jgi:hypothetical protein
MELEYAYLKQIIILEKIIHAIFIKLIWLKYC